MYTAVAGEAATVRQTDTQWDLSAAAGAVVTGEHVRAPLTHSLTCSQQDEHTARRLQ